MPNIATALRDEIKRLFPATKPYPNRSDQEGNRGSSARHCTAEAAGRAARAPSQVTNAPPAKRIVGSAGERART